MSQNVYNPSNIAPQPPSLDELRLDGAAEIERRQREQHKVVAELRAEAEDQHQECEGEYRCMHENILNALGQLADYKEHVQRRLAETSGELQLLVLSSMPLNYKILY